MTTPANLPSQVGVPSGSPNSQFVAMYLTQFVQAIGTWVARAANAVNWLLAFVSGRATATVSSTTLGLSTTSTTFVSSGLFLSIEPSYSGRLLVTGGFQAAGSGSGTIELGLWYGVGVPPAQGVAISGTEFGGIAVVAMTTPNITIPISGLIHSTAVGTKYWITAGMKIGSGTLSCNFAYLEAAEL